MTVTSSRIIVTNQIIAIFITHCSCYKFPNILFLLITSVKLWWSLSPLPNLLLEALIKTHLLLNHQFVLKYFDTHVTIFMTSFICLALCPLKNWNTYKGLMLFLTSKGFKALTEVRTLRFRHRGLCMHSDEGTGELGDLKNQGKDLPDGSESKGACRQA